MRNLFYEGGPLFMGIVTAVFIIMVVWAIFHFLPVLTKKEFDPVKTADRLKHIKTIGTLAMVLGILGQLIGLMSAFDVIERVGDISPSLVAGGLKVSTIPTVYGILVFIISLIIWIILDYIVSKKNS
ncbi:MotA/TolQ/ExbB proton channel family protein [Maribellus sediminis]|uniref:MotA/TolQ/ExbB proton channel family protein n=1 Tax=Maribellus sediminis TaxID=2696285 RepID=UPI001430B29C|nr:MotA/TolQ/ExbB proton channel family protein [Maribellus sediminis]